MAATRDAHQNEETKQTISQSGSRCLRMRVEHSEVHRPEHLPDVKDIADYRVVDSFRYRQLLGPADRAFLDKKRDDT